MAVWTVRVLDGEDPEAITETRFDDVDSDSSHAPFIERMSELGVTEGCGDGSGFCPDRTVTRAQMAAFLSRAYELPAAPDPGFSDVADDAWYAADVARLAASEITVGCGDGTAFCPRRDTTRAEMATFLHRAENRRDAEQSSDADEGGGSSGGGSSSSGSGGGGSGSSGGGSSSSGSGGGGSGSSNGGSSSSGSGGGGSGSSNGAIQCWGEDEVGQATAVAPGAGLHYVAVGAGGVHSCGLLDNGAVQCWGEDAEGQSTATPAPPGASHTAVAAGWFHTCGLLSTDTVQCWGHNDEGAAVDQPEVFADPR